MTKMKFAVRSALGQLGQSDRQTFINSCSDGGGFTDTTVNSDGSTTLKCINGDKDGDSITIPSATAPSSSSSSSTPSSGDSYCIRVVQNYLVGQGRLPATSVTGTWNPETSAYLDRVFGAKWRSLPGGPCALIAALKIAPLPPNTIFTQATTFAQSPAGIAIGIGAALLVLTLVMRK